NELDFSGQNFYCGIDTHKKKWAVTIEGVEKVYKVYKVYKVSREDNVVYSLPPATTTVRS
ncbi:MAG: hypothetical protein RQ743_13775, partial [Bacteroidales bacterium]|nr:hypothetical protein [Bacteroidales bacterium]